MATTAFARCRGFLNYHPLARWLAIKVSSIATAILYLGLIVLLGFFINLMVERRNPGVPASLGSHPQALPGRHRQCRREPQEAGGGDQIARAHGGREGVGCRRTGRKLAAAQERALLWRGDMLRYLKDKVPDAADMVHEKSKTAREQFGADAPFHDLANCGILSQVVRWRYGFSSRLLTWIADWIPSTWSDGNSLFLLDLLTFAALGLAVVRLIAMFLSRYLGTGSSPSSKRSRGRRVGLSANQPARHAPHARSGAERSGQRFHAASGSRA